jgi:hypothetical protein
MQCVQYNTLEMKGTCVNCCILFQNLYQLISSIFNPLSRIVPYFIVLPSLSNARSFTRQGESTEPFNGLIRLSAYAPCLYNPLSGNVPYFIALLCLTPDDLLVG